MKKEFKKIKTGGEIRYVLETMTSGATGSASVATSPGSLGILQKRLKELKQRVAEMSPDNAEYNDEAGMADNNLETLKRAVDGLDDLINAGDNLPEWCQEKIAVAKSMLVAVWDYMQSEEKREMEGVAGGLAGGAIGAALTKTPGGAVTGYKIGSTAQDLLSKDSDANENVAGPEKCWPGYRKVGTKPGTGKNAGKRVNDCEKIKEDYTDDLGNVYALHPDPEEAEGITFNIADIDDEEDFIERWRGVPRRYQEIFNYDIPLWGENDMDVSSYPNMIVKKLTFDQYVKMVGDYLRSEELSTGAMSKMKRGVKEVAPKGWEGTVKAMKKHKDIDNPWALAHWMKGKGYKSHKKEDAYLESLTSKLSEKLGPEHSLDQWKDTFKSANPEQYRQFKNKTPEKKEQMAISARYKKVQNPK